jgi:hypothetical protein
VLQTFPDRVGRRAAADACRFGAVPNDDASAAPGGAGEPRGFVLTRGWALFLVAVGVWNWVIWPRFALAIWDDPRAWSTRIVGHGTPTGFLWVHAVLIVASLAIGTTAGVLGIRALLRLRRRPSTPADRAADTAGAGR